MIGRPRKYHSAEEHRQARKEQARGRQLRKRLDKMDAGFRRVIARIEADKKRRTRNESGLTYRQKRALARELIQAAGAIVENLRVTGVRDLLERLDPDEVAKQLALWLKDLPGKYWDQRLGPRDPSADQLRAEFESATLEAAASTPSRAPAARPGVKVAGFDL